MVTVTGDNPYVFRVRDQRLKPGEEPGLNHVIAINWEVVKADGSDCLAVVVEPVAGSGLTLETVERVRQPDGSDAFHKVVRSVPQAIKVTVSCGECTCGREFSVDVIAGIYPRQPGIASAWNPWPTRVSIFCAGPGCKEKIRIAGLTEPRQFGELAALTDEELDRLERGGVVAASQPRRKRREV